MSRCQKNAKKSLILDINKTGPVVIVKLPGPFYHCDMEVAFIVLVIPFQNMPWLKREISDNAKALRALINGLPCCFMTFKF